MDWKKFTSNLVILGTICLTSANKYLENSFTDDTNEGKFQNLVMDQTTGYIYLGATNRLYQLEDNLNLYKSVVTGPKEDSPACPPPPDECTCTATQVQNCEAYAKKMTPSYSKALVIDKSRNTLIACTNLYQGHCDRRDLGDVSTLLNEIMIPIVPNDENSPTVMFIAPGVPKSSTEKVLYVGSTRSSIGITAYKDLIPTFSSRNITTFELSYKSEFGTGSTKKELESQQRDTFFVYYQYGFSSGGFSYLLTVQRKSVDANSEYVSRLVRVCQNDANFYSYTEVPLVCEHNGAKYNIVRSAYVTRPGSTLAVSLGLPHIPPLTENEDVLFALFSRGQPKQLVSDSVLCIYKLNDIRTIFTKTIRDCFTGVGNTGPAHIVKPDPCVDTPFKGEIDDNYCGKFEINSPVAGVNPIKDQALIRFPQSLVTSLTVTTITNHTIAFIGTSTGTLKKVLIKSKTEAVEYDSIAVETNRSIHKDIVLDKSGQHLYLMNDHKVFKFKVQDCAKYDSCTSCLGAQDPYCGWCALENKCTMKSQCDGSEVSNRWLPHNGPQCIKITRVSPEFVAILRETTPMLAITILNLPDLTSGQYQCAFSGSGTQRITEATKRSGSDNQIECLTPAFNLLPPIPTGKDHIVMDLAIRMDGKDFVNTNITFFNCKLHTSCTSCTKSAYQCTWCVRKHTCTNNPQDDCLTDVLVTGQALHGQSDKPGPGMCPRIEASYTEIRVPSGTRKTVTVTALNLEPFQDRFVCKFHDGTEKEVEAQKTGSNLIECNSVKFQYDGLSPYRNVPFQILWGDSTDNKPLDNPDLIQVKVYKCSVMADTCGSCLTLDTQYSCGWCETGCSIQNQCRTGNWLDSSQICPNPLITKFSPTSGPKEGGTKLTIEGVNLGKGFDDIKSGLIVAGVRCDPEPYADEYIPSTRIVCKTGASSETKAGNVVVIVSNRYRGESDAYFDYVNPAITSYHPTKGPQSGGTRLTILGRHLNAGTEMSLKVASLPCEPISIAEQQVECLTSASEAEKSGKLIMTFDAGSARHNERFHYVQDPIVTMVYPETSILSGGLRFTVTGESFDSILEPKMYIKLGNQEITSPCDMNSPKQMICHSPNITMAGYRPTTEQPLHVAYGFLLDNVIPMKNLTNYSNGDRLFAYYPDPHFEPFPEGNKYFQAKNEYLTINGKNLNVVLTKDDVTVKVGQAFCNVTSIAKEQLTCRPPPPNTEGVGSDPKVVVIVGMNPPIEIGSLTYEGPENILSLPAIIGIAAGGSILIFIIIVICIAYKKQSKESNRVMKRMQNQMDVLEARVAKECKEAFAELQTDMTELTQDLAGNMGIPFRGYRNFCMRVLFPNVREEDHPVTAQSYQDEYTRKPSWCKGLQQFNQLIGHKTFLLLFIRTLETHKNFTMRDRVNVASLISVTLQDRMEYHTEMLKTLLADLIERSMDDRSHPKLLLRRTESVAEKMLTNWFTFLLYKFLQDCAGERLFMLYRAIKQQVDKGPVDAFTSEAKYSLSEDKLIRQQLDYKVLTIYVMDPECKGQEHPVKVLDCDSISQVKEKILDALYKNIPYSSDRRPDKEDLDLEFRNGQRGRVILQDEDNTTKTEGDHKKVNTLSHYKVPDHARMGLVTKQSSNYTLSMGSDRSGSSHQRFGDYYSTGSPSLSRSLSPHAIQVEVENGAKCYHLVKPHLDNDQQREGDRGSKMVSEIYLTRLLATKGTLQTYVDDLFETIFSTTNRGSALPLAIKYMFDFLDDQALQHGITDHEVVHTWKSNTLPLRFWVNVVKNPDFVFDIHKSNIVDSCLSVVAQTFMDSCSMSEHRLGKDSPSSKLLYAKDIPKYKKWVERYYQDIKLMPAISDQDMNAMLAEESRLHKQDYNLNAALYELYQYVCQYNDELVATLDDDEFARNYRLAYKLEQVHANMDSDV